MKYTFMENFKDKDPEFYDFYSHFIGEEVINPVFRGYHYVF